MKKLWKIFACSIFAIVLTFGMTGCEIAEKGKEILSSVKNYFSNMDCAGSKDNDGDSTDGKTYTILYTHEKTYTITVRHGELWQMETPLPTKDGYEFDGLYDAEQGGQKYASKDGTCTEAFLVDRNLVLYPRFIPKEYTLTLNYGQASQVGVPSITAKTETALSELPGGLAVTGADYLIFKGWFTEENCGGLMVADVLGRPQVSVVEIFRGSEETSKTLYAGFALRTYPVRFFDKADGDMLEEKQVEHGSKIADVAPPIEIDGKSVSGWSTNPSGNTAYTGVVKDEMNFYPVLYSVTVRFETDCGEGVDDEKVTFAGKNNGTSYLILPIPSRTGYHFLGWNDGEKILTTEPYYPNKHITLTAKWQAKKTTISFDVNEGVLAGEAQKIVSYDQAYSLPMPTYKEKGYVFGGWVYGNKIIPAVGNWEIEEEEILLVAKWELIVCEVTLDSQGGTSYGMYSIAYNEDYLLPIPTRTGYTFLGWKNGISFFASSGTWTLENTSLKLTAAWEANTSLVTLDPKGGGISTSTLTLTYDKSYTLPIPTPKEKGYVFSGWYYGANSVDRVGTWEITAEEVVLTARWELLVCTISFNSQGGSSCASYSATYGEAYSLPTPTRKGYTFLGWKNGGASFASMGIWKLEQTNLVLTADWEVKSYLITLDVNGGAMTESFSQTIKYGELYTLPVPSRSGYTFSGWFSAKIGGKRITDSKGCSISKYFEEFENTLYAVYLKSQEVSMKRASCKKGNGYNPAESGTDMDVLAHSNFELVNLVVANCVQGNDGTFWIPDGESLTLGFKVLKDTAHLPTSSLNGASVNWTIHHIKNDTVNTSVWGTNIVGKQVGHGAYYIKVNFSDGTYAEFNGVNFLKDVAEGATVQVLELDLAEKKKITSIDAVCVYELYYDYMSGIWDWDGTKRQANWRNTATIVFDE